MTLDYKEILDIITNRPNIDFIKAAQAQYQKLRMFFTGEGVEDYVENIEEFMREGTKDTLVKFMRSNRDTIHRVMAPRNKIYTAKGGLTQINLPEDLQTDFSIFLQSITEGLPLDEWIRNIVQMRYDYDPNGLIQIEINSDDEPYPRVRCIDEVYDYLNNGRALEYVVFEIGKEERGAYISAGIIPADTPPRNKVYRVIDDVADRIVSIGSRGSIGTTYENMTVVSEVPNEFGYVPCMIISDIWGVDNYFESPLSVSLNLLDAMLTDRALYSWAYWRNVFPKEWMQKFKCPTCDGHALLDGQDCPECHGKGYLPFLRTADVAIVDYRNDENKSIPHPPLGRIESDIAALQFMYDNNMTLEQYFYLTTWGVTESAGQNRTLIAGQKSSGGGGGDTSKTAYEAQLNTQPQHERLRLFGKWKVSIQRFIIDACAWYKYRDQFQGSAIICGDRFMIESPDATWERYLKAVQGKAPMYTLDTLLIEYNENKFDGNPELYRKAELLRQVEPFVHEPVETIWTDPQLSLTERMEKKYFDEWTSTLTDYDIASVPDEGGAVILREKLRQYVTTRYVEMKKYDALLMTATGEIINIGDEVRVIHGKEQKSDHNGRIFKVTDIVDRNVTMSGGGMDGVFGYTTADLQKVGTQEMQLVS